MTTFTTECFQNEYLAEGATEVNAIVTVTSDGTASVGVSEEAVEIIVIDVSGSMEHPQSKIRAARRATAAAVDAIDDGVWFGVIAGSGRAAMVFPPADKRNPPTLLRASAATRANAKEEIRRLEAGGGTAIGNWLAAAAELFAQRPDARHHAILLTDGKNEGEDPAHFAEVLAACAGRFQCDCRGIGTDWDVAELRRVASALLGTVDIVADPADLEADFEAMTAASMGRAVGKVSLRLWTPKGARIRFVKQVNPNLEDLTGTRVEVNPLTGDYALGAWGAESRDYHVCVDVPAGGIGAEMLAARASVVVGDAVQAQALVKAIWTDDAALSTRINREVAHFTGQAELADAIQQGLAARKGGDEATATVRLGRAVQLAQASGNEATTRLLARVVDVEDAATGKVRLKAGVADADEMTLDTRSTKTVRLR